MHEKLFIFGKAWISFSIFQNLILIQSLWFVFFFNYFIVNYQYFYLFEIFLVCVSLGTTIFFLMPQILYYLTINTNVNLKLDSNDEKQENH